MRSWPTQLKHFFSPALVRRLAGDITRVHRPFPADAFVRQATRGLSRARVARPRPPHRACPRRAPAGGLSRGHRRAGALARRRTPDRRTARPRHGAVLLPAAHDVRGRTRARSLRAVDGGAARADAALQRRGEHSPLHRARSGTDARPARDVDARCQSARAPPGLRRHAVAPAVGAARAAGSTSIPSECWRCSNVSRTTRRRSCGAASPTTSTISGRCIPRCSMRTCAAWLTEASPDRRALVEHALAQRREAGRARGAAAARLRPSGRP